ncbi:MAG: hypothetical protein HN704_06845 [Bacteroidetes bacterium]|nr:hypothetical protein [Bacteroidota bacterium]MBT6686422.1 hypothetical protein [Bacteroidota bacterium]MBT7144661.1 hypothetical protein [Bacteroidota bacterium]MBT7491304.1 hypothetical protein [Bacteroidota bacterium]
MKNPIIRILVGAFVAFIVLFFFHYLLDKKMDFWLLVPVVIVSVHFGYIEFKSIKKEKRNFLNGIELIKQKQTFVYDNLSICLKSENNETLTIRNQLFWEEAEEQNTAKFDDTIDDLIQDFRKIIHRNKEFKKFVSNKTLEFQLIDNISNHEEKLLACKILKPSQ